MFDSLKKAIKTFSGKVAEEAEVKDAPPAPAPAKAAPPPAKPAPQTAKPAPAKAETKFEIIEDDEDDLLDDELKAELEAIEREAEAANRAPAAPPPPPKPAAPAPAPKPAAPAPPAPKPAAPPSAPAAKPATPATVPPKPAPPAAVPPKPAPAPAPVPPKPAAAPTPPPAPAKPAPQPVAAQVPRPAPKPEPAPAPAPPKAGGKTIQLDKIDDLLWDLELALLESDVALPVVEEIKETLKEKLPKVRVDSAEDVPRAVEQALREAILDALNVEPIDFDAWILEKTMEKKPVVVMFVGVNGTGKTTSIGRIAYRLKENGFTSVMAAGDTFRAGAIQQLERHAEKVGVTLIKTNAGGDPAAVAFDAIEHAKGRMKDVVLLDTAGRMQTNTNLMDEMKKIKRVAKPDLIVFVGDSLAGNDAVEQAVHFDKAVGIDAVVLTKVDTDAKGGAALSIAKAVGKPILFLGVGQEYGDIVPYDPQWMVDRIFETA